MTQNKFVTRTLFIFHKSVKMSAIPAKWTMDLEMIQKLTMFVSYFLVTCLLLNNGRFVSLSLSHFQLAHVIL